MNNTPQCVLIKLLKDQREKNFKKKKIFFSKENKLTLKKNQENSSKI